MPFDLLRRLFSRPVPEPARARRPRPITLRPVPPEEVAEAMLARTMAQALALNAAPACDRYTDPPCPPFDPARAYVATSDDSPDLP